MRRDGSRLLVLALAGAAALVACGGGASTGGNSGSSGSHPSAAAVAPLPAIPAASLPLSHPTVWLCRPGLADNPCDGNLDATVVNPDLSTSVQKFTPAANAPIDCFYIYPTTATDSTVNAPLAPEPAVISTTRAQVARFSSVCKLYVPVYRQLTLQAITSPGKITPAAVALATSDVISAWHDYLAHYNDGRGVVLIGHSQGAGELKNLISTEIDKSPAERARIVSALLMGGNVQVPIGKDVGGDFTNVPACRRTDQTGCVVAYSTFDQVPPANSLFGRVSPNGRNSLGSSGSPAGKQILCVNPGNLAGGTSVAHPYFPTRSLSSGGSLPGTAPSSLPDLPTGFVSLPRDVTIGCQSQGGATWLNVKYGVSNPDKRPEVANPLPATWGLHLQDMNIDQGDLITLVGDQSAAWRH